MTTYLNMKSVYGTETVDELSSEDFQSYRDFRKEVSRLITEYHMTGTPVYASSRCTKDWKEK